jgi:hypothetical protein
MIDLTLYKYTGGDHKKTTLEVTSIAKNMLILYKLGEKLGLTQNLYKISVTFQSKMNLT